MDDKVRAELYEHAWKCFSLHADQRLKTFHFFVLLSTVVGGGLFALLKDRQHFFMAGLLAMLLPFLAFVFWKLETRNRQLVKHAETALKFMEGEYQLPPQGELPHPLQIFRSEERATALLPRFPHAGFAKVHLSYSRCFNAVFAVFGIGGLIAALVLFVAAYRT